MKKLLLALIFGFALSIHAQDVAVKAFTLSATGVPANSTNSTDGTVLKISNPKDTCRIYVTATGVAATTNGSFIVRFSTASGTDSSTNAFDSSTAGNINITIPTLGASTRSQSDWFQIRGIKYLRVGSMENTFGGAVTNVAVLFSTTTGGEK